MSSKFHSWYNVHQKRQDPTLTKRAASQLEVGAAGNFFRPDVYAKYLQMQEGQLLLDEDVHDLKVCFLSGVAL